MGSTGVKIKTITLKEFKCFDNIEIDCRKDDESFHQWTVLLGNNNTGKTNLLKAIANLRPISVNLLDTKGDKVDKEQFAPIFIESSEFAQLGKVKYLVECETNFSDISCSYGTGVCSASSSYAMKNFQIYGYGVSRYPSSTSLTETTTDDCATLFSQDKHLVNIEEWLMQLDYAAKNSKEAAQKRLDKIKELLCGSLFPEIINFKFESSDEFHNYTLFQTKDGWFRYTDLGFGYQSMLSWIVDFCKRMFERYPDSANPLHENAIVLIDEIDLHLHPKWQRDIIYLLSKTFPNTQFIATTHSPLIIQSMNDVNLYILHRQDDKVIAEHSTVSNFNGWTVEEILRDTMKLESDINTDKYQEFMGNFDLSLDNEDREEAKKAYESLAKILHPNNPVKRLLELQLSQLEDND